MLSLFQPTPISDAGKTLPVVLYPRSKVPTLESVETTWDEEMRSTSATRSPGKGKWSSSLSRTVVGAQLQRISTGTANMARLATARTAKVVPGLTTCTESRTRSNLHFRKVYLSHLSHSSDACRSAAWNIVGSPFPLFRPSTSAPTSSLFLNMKTVWKP